MLLNGLEQVRCAPIVQEKHTLADSPQGRCAELVRTGIPLRDAVGEVAPHVMQGQIGEEIGLYMREA